MIVRGVLFEQIVSRHLGASQVSHLVVNPVTQLLVPVLYTYY